MNPAAVCLMAFVAFSSAAVVCPAGMEYAKIRATEDFERFNVNDPIVATAGNPYWITYSSNSPSSDSTVRNAPGGGKAVYFDETTNPDVVYKFINQGSLEGGNFTFQFDVNVDVGAAFTGYFYSSVGLDSVGSASTLAGVWSEITAGKIQIADLGNPAATKGMVSYTQASWVTLKFNFNLDAKIYEFFVAGAQIASWTGSFSIIGGIEFYGDVSCCTDKWYVDNIVSEYTNTSLCVVASASPSASPSPSPSTGAGAVVSSPSRSPINTDPVTLTLKQSSSLAGVPLSEIAKAAGVSEGNITVVSTSVTGGAREEHHATRDASCFDTNGVTRVVTLLFADAGAAARLAALVNAADGSVRTSGLCVLSSTSTSTKGTAPISGNVIIVDATEYNRIAIGLGVGFGVGLTLLFALLLIAFCCCLNVVPIAARTISPAAAAAAAPVTVVRKSYSAYSYEGSDNADDADDADSSNDEY